MRNYKGKPKAGIQYSLNMGCGPVTIIHEFIFRECSPSDKYIGPKTTQISCKVSGTKMSYDKYFIKDKSGVKHSVVAKSSTTYPICDENHRQKITDTVYSFHNSSTTLTVREDLTYKGNQKPDTPKPNL